MKSFKDLVFTPHPNSIGKRAKIFFDNNYGASIVSGPLCYSNGIDTYELAVLTGNHKASGITYDTEITDDVLGYLSETQVTEALKQIQQLKSTIT